jgi:hypothetical protein
MARSGQSLRQDPQTVVRRHRANPKRLWSDRTGRDRNQMRRSSSTHRMAFDRWNQGPPLRTGIASHLAAAVGTFKPIHGLQPRDEQRVALSKRPNRFFHIVRRNAHAEKMTELRSKTVAPRAHNSARRRRPSEPKAARRILLARPSPAVKTRRMSRIAKGP